MTSNKPEDVPVSENSSATPVETPVADPSTTEVPSTSVVTPTAVAPKDKPSITSPEPKASNRLAIAIVASVAGVFLIFSAGILTGVNISNAHYDNGYKMQDRSGHTSQENENNSPRGGFDQQRGNKGQEQSPSTEDLDNGGEETDNWDVAPSEDDITPLKKVTPPTSETE